MTIFKVRRAVPLWPSGLSSYLAGQINPDLNGVFKSIEKKDSSWIKPSENGHFSKLENGWSEQPQTISL
jgi:hypothetical protein